MGGGPFYPFREGIQSAKPCSTSYGQCSDRKLAKAKTENTSGAQGYETRRCQLRPVDMIRESKPNYQCVREDVGGFVCMI